MSVSLVTGGAGFMGSHVAALCLELGHDVVVLDDLSGGFRENVPSRATFVEGSITDAALVNRLFDTYAFDFVYHLAAYAAEGLSHFIRSYNYSNNVLGSINLINASVNANTVKRFVFTSSIAVYGPGQTPMLEEMVPTPEDPYGIAKYGVELDLKAAHEMFGLDYTIFRPHNVYGEHQNIGDRYRNVVGIFMNNVMQDKPLPVFGDGLQTRAFTHISDVAPTIAKCVMNARARNQVFNVGSESPRTVLDVARAVSASFGAQLNVAHLPARKEVVHAFSSSAHADDVFGKQNTLSLEEGVGRMAQWAKKHGPRTTKTFTGIEVERNLPASWRS
ncbi:MAG: NAD-dependent epimerase/dehydratase family protein [Planctomycetia bacterium]